MHNLQASTRLSDFGEGRPQLGMTPYERRSGMKSALPAFLREHQELYDINPRAACLKWFDDAGLGLLLHYGPYVALARGDKVMLREKITPTAYRKLADEMDVSGFDAGFVTDLALKAGVRYVSMCVRHHDSFSLYATQYKEGPYKGYNVKAVTGRDLFGELAAACHKKGLGLFISYSYGRDWYHPYFYDAGPGMNAPARPAYEVRPAQYAYRERQDFSKYVEFCHFQLQELLTNYGPIAGVSFDIESAIYANPGMFPIDETYALVRQLQPHALISYKRGVNGGEDFLCPEVRELSGEAVSAVPNIEKFFKGPGITDEARERAIAMAHILDSLNRSKKIEYMATMQCGVSKDWRGAPPAADVENGYAQALAHRSADDLWALYEGLAVTGRANLLLTLGLSPDGAVYSSDSAALENLGARRRNEKIL